MEYLISFPAPELFLINHHSALNNQEAVASPDGCGGCSSHQVMRPGGGGEAHYAAVEPQKGTLRRCASVVGFK